MFSQNEIETGIVRKTDTERVDRDRDRDRDQYRNRHNDRNRDASIKARQREIIREERTDKSGESRTDK